MKKSTLVLGIGVVLLLKACTTITKTKTETDNIFQVISPMVMDTSNINEYVADINAIQNVEIRARIKGYIENIYVDEGQRVHKKQLLFAISSKEHEQELLKAKAVLKNAVAELKSAKIKLKNTKELVDEDIVSETELEMLKVQVDALSANVARAQSDKKQAQLNLSFTNIRAPFDGIINRIPKRVGSLIEEGQLLTSISNNKEVFAYFNVSEKDYLEYAISKNTKKQKEVNLILANGSKYPHVGIIETTESEFDKNTGNIAFRARFPNPDLILKHGSSGKILVKNKLKDAILIPQKSTFEIQENLYVYVVDNDNTVQIREIVPSLRLPHLFVVNSGLTYQTKIIYEGIQRVKEGDKINPEQISIASNKN